MPAILSHWLHGSRVLPELKKRIHSVDIDENSFLWGCQGPDILFFSRLMPWMSGQNVRKYGSKLHDGDPMRVFQPLFELIEVCGVKNYDRLMSYCLGMCCHYSLDRTAHPYVIYLENSMVCNDPRGEDYHYHGEIESMLDVILLRREKGLIPADVSLSDCIPEDAAVSSMMSLVYTKMLYRSFGLKLEPRCARQLTGDMRTCFNVLNDRYSLRMPVIETVENILWKGHSTGSMSAFMRPYAEKLSYDYGNFCHKEWHNIYAPRERSRFDIFEIFDSAVEDALSTVEQFLNAVSNKCSFGQYTENKTFSFGTRETTC